MAKKRSKSDGRSINKRRSASRPAADPPGAEAYKHPTAESLLRPDVGTQAQFRKKKPPVTYRYDSSLSPALDWDGQNPAREQGEALIKQVLDAARLRAPRPPARSSGDNGTQVSKTPFAIGENLLPETVRSARQIDRHT